MRRTWGKLNGIEFPDPEFYLWNVVIWASWVGLREYLDDRYEFVARLESNVLMLILGKMELSGLEVEYTWCV